MSQTDASSTLRTTEQARRVHFTAIGGVGTASLAAMLKEKGHQVTGSDQGVYPPMSDFLARTGIPVMQGYRPENLYPTPDLVIVGNAVSRTNPEVQALLESSIPYLSLPQALALFFLAGKRSVVIAGTHGKTTATAMLAWVLEKAGRDPSFLAGGLSRNFQQGYKLGGGEFFVVEGDEYDSAFFDKGPKFLHYQPQAVLLNVIEFDHADIYRDLEQVKDAFCRLLEILPVHAPLIVGSDFPSAFDVVQTSGHSFSTFGLNDSAAWQAQEVQDDGRRIRFTVCHRGEKVGSFVLPLMGRMNVRNALGVIALAVELELSPEEIAPGLRSFLGVERRQELVGEANGITIIDDFAHHPTAVSVTIEAVRFRYPERRLWAVFEPRSNTCRRRIFQKDLAAALSLADRVVIGPVYTKPQDPLSAAELFSPAELAADLQALGREAHAGEGVEEICSHLARASRPGDVILIMSNGAFGGLPRKLLAALQEKKTS